ncbi:MAG: T9SS type A sorting domain-containing protein [Bacteroidetes bacterium]|nr:T9SS type A sorting domain-containing protein [Bacteroidota bacterium]
MINFSRRMILLFFILFSIQGFTQNYNLDSLQTARQEFYFELKFDDFKQLSTFNQMMSIDQIDGGRIIAYASPSQYQRILDAGHSPTLLLPPSLEYIEQNMLDVEDLGQKNDWNYYPTYEAYVAMMQSFQTNYPNLCSIHNIGTLSSGRQLLMARINNGNTTGKAEFLYTATMHGDETTGYVLTLRLIDQLLTNYGSDPMITNLVDNLDIWINPLANPDGTFWGGNHTVSGSRRGNANNVDLNRNYPDPEDGPNPDGNSWQPETVAFKNFADQRNFVLSANFHGGIEVVNYPWDTWSRRHADDNWWIFVSREYADTAQFYSPPGYMTAYNNGITNGYDWYTISGGRQDYMNYFHHCREFTLEISNSKTLPASQLPAHWNYNYKSMVNYMKQTLYGFHGTITDSITGAPISAKVEIVGHELDNSFVYSSLPAGNFHRPVKAGTYNLTFSADGYYSKTIYGLSVGDRQKIDLDVQLAPGIIIANFNASANEIPKGGQINFTDNSFGQNIISWAWIFEGGIPSTSNLQNPTNISYPNAGVFDVQLTVTNANGETSTILKENLITVTSMYVMINGTFNTCEGTFYDPGGPNGNYGNNQTMTMTFIPDTAEALMKVEFTMFDLEAHSSCNYDWLKIYNGLNTSAPLLGTWCGTNSPGTIIANNPGKGLTFQFSSDGSVTKAGWSALLSCFSTVSVEENSKTDVNIYPNPSKDGVVNIHTDAFMTGIKLFSINGKLLFEEKFDQRNEFQIVTSGILKGMYLIEITTTENKITRKLLLD